MTVTRWQRHRDPGTAGTGAGGRGKETHALDVPGAALVLVCPQGYVRVFADEGPPMAALVAAQPEDHAAARSVPLGCLARLLRGFGGTDDAPGALPA